MREVAAGLMERAGCSQDDADLVARNIVNRRPFNVDEFGQGDIKFMISEARGEYRALHERRRSSAARSDQHRKDADG